MSQAVAISTDADTAKAGAPHEDIVGSLWAISHVLRDDGLSSHDYMLELSYLLFLKLLHEAGHDKELPPGCRWPDLVDSNKGKRLSLYREALIRLGSETEGRVRTIYEGARTRIRNEASFEHVIDRLDRDTWFANGREGLGDAYEGLLERAAAERKSAAGQYFTPRPLVDLLVALMKPAPGEVVLDPACGTGGFLVSSAVPRRGNREITHVGVELVPDVARLALMNFAVHRLEGDIVVGDSLYEPGLKLPSADLILTNPPFGTRGTPAMRFSERVPIPTRNKQLAFLQMIVHQLRPGGRAAVIVPDNVLFESGIAEAVRTQLIDACHLHTVLRLPAGIFYATGVRTNVVFLTKRTDDGGAPDEELVWIFDARTGTPPFGKRRPLTREDFEVFEQVFGHDPKGISPRTDQGPEGRFRPFPIAELRGRGLDFDINWLNDRSASADPERLAREMSGALQDALNALAELELELGR